MFRTSALALTFASLLLLAPHAAAAQYSFVNIADTRGPFDNLGFLDQAVSDTGTVAFIGAQGGVAGTYVGDGASTINIVPDLSPPPGFNDGGAGVLNESGVAVGGISCCAPLQQKVLLYEASGTQTIAETANDTAVFRYMSGRDINDAGAVAILSYTITYGSGNGPQWSITRWFDGTSTTVLETTEGFESVDFDSIRINELGDVAFRGSRDGAAFSYYRTDGTTLTLIADGTGPLNTSSATYLAVNDSGAVAFWSPLDAGGEGIFVGDGGPLNTIVIADSTTPFHDLMWSESIDINNQGAVAFFAGLWDGRNGIFTGPDPVNDKIIAHGDFLFGQFVTGLGRPHLNERGDMAFWFEVRDPRDPSGYWTGIALAVKESPIAGDFNHNGTVDAADYVVWRKNPAGIYTQNDYTVWRANFGQTAGTGSGATGSASAVAPVVPEPATPVLLILAIGIRWRDRRSELAL